MERPRVWQIVLFAVAAIAVAVSAYFTLFRDGLDLPHKLVLVDVQTGDLYSIDPSGKTIPIPARSPVSGEETLYPVARDEGGAWVLDARSLDEVLAFGDRIAGTIDSETGRVVGESKRVRTITPRDLRKRN
ncbi:MAG TPA: hypothetical protein VFF69_13685 [Phycisphaerales bacterium]|nr:hypothetical protein [Phycisphaerales bacterium]